MKVFQNKHIRMFSISTIIYVLFILRGLSTNHFLGLPLDFYFFETFEIIIFLIPAGIFILKLVSSKENYVKDAAWLAFYTTILFVVYDFIFLGIFKGFGFAYLGKWWFLTIFYVILWFEFPIVGYLMKKNDLKLEKKHFLMIGISFVCWIINYWGGLASNHFQSWMVDMKLMRISNIPLILIPIVILFLRHNSDKKNYLKDAWVFAMYMIFVFILCDFQYLGIAKGSGLGYIIDYWFAALFYPIFLFTIPLIGWLMKRSKK